MYRQQSVSDIEKIVPKQNGILGAQRWRPILHVFLKVAQVRVL